MLRFVTPPGALAETEQLQVGPDAGLAAFHIQPASRPDGCTSIVPAGSGAGRIARLPRSRRG